MVLVEASEALAPPNELEAAWAEPSPLKIATVYGDFEQDFEVVNGKIRRKRHTRPAPRSERPSTHTMRTRSQTQSEVTQTQSEVTLPGHNHNL